MRAQRWLISVVSALAAAGCGLQQSPGAQPAAPADQPKYGGTLAIYDVGDPFDWDLSGGGQNGVNTSLASFVREGIVDMKAGPDVPFGESVIQPALAERWEINRDATVYTFHLRKGAKFTPSTGSGNILGVNGREVTSADVKFSYEYYTRTGEFKDKKPASTVAWTFEGIESVTTPDRYTAVVKFREPRASFMGIAASEKWSAIVPREIYDRDGHLKDKLIGTGPFYLDEPASQKGSRWVLKKNPGYHREGRPYVDGVRYLILADEAAAGAAFQTKQLDILTLGITGYGTEAAEAIRRGAPDAVVTSLTSTVPNNFLFNTRVPPLDDIRVRRAMALGINRDEFLQAFSRGQGEWGLSPSYLGMFTQEEKRQLIKYDPEQAKRLLVEAGHPNGINLEFLYTPDRGEQYINDMQLLIAQLRRVNINVTARAVDKAADTQRKIKGDFELSMVPNARTVGDVMDWPLSHFLPGGSSNFNQLDDPKAMALVRAGEAEPDLAKRKEIVKQIARYANDNVLALGIYHSVRHYLWHPYVKGFGLNFWKRGGPVEDVWLDR